MGPFGSLSAVHSRNLFCASAVQCVAASASCSRATSRSRLRRRLESAVSRFLGQGDYEPVENGVPPSRSKCRHVRNVLEGASVSAFGHVIPRGENARENMEHLLERAGRKKRSVQARVGQRLAVDLK